MTLARVLKLFWQALLALASYPQPIITPTQYSFCTYTSRTYELLGSDLVQPLDLVFVAKHITLSVDNMMRQARITDNSNSFRVNLLIRCFLTQWYSSFLVLFQASDV